MSAGFSIKCCLSWQRFFSCFFFFRFHFFVCSVCVILWTGLNVCWNAIWRVICMSRYFLLLPFLKFFQIVDRWMGRATQFTIHNSQRVPCSVYLQPLEIIIWMRLLLLLLEFSLWHFLCHFNSHINIFRLFTGFYVSRKLHNERKSKEKNRNEISRSMTYLLPKVIQIPYIMLK